jgi:membrane protein required for colicin V production
MNALDMFVIGVIVLSGLLAFARGFVKEALSIVGWIGAIAASAYALPYVRPLTQHLVRSTAVADAIAAGVVFIVVLIILSVITSAIARRVKHSSLSALDRTLGLIFGLARGALLVCIAFIALSFVLPRGGDRPRWVADARTLPLVADATDRLTRLMPDSFRKQATQLAPGGAKLDNDYLSVLRAYSTPGAKPGAAPGIAPEDQQRLNQLIQQIGSNPERLNELVQKYGANPDVQRKLQDQAGQLGAAPSGGNP